MGLAIRIAALFSGKAEKWITGRKRLFERLEAQVDTANSWIWCHAASLGEFEQGRPLIEALRKGYPEHKILLTFFSPSGYEIRKDYNQADLVMYIPLDTPANARRFLRIVKPQLIVFVKYEIWLNFMKLAVQQGIPFLLISAQFRPGQWFFRWYGRKAENILRSLTQIFTADRSSAKLLGQRQFHNAACAGDTRVDRVIQISREAEDFSWLQDKLNGTRILVAGSTWPRDEEILKQVQDDETYGLVIAPHDVSETRLAGIERMFEGKISRLSRMQKSDTRRNDMILVDTMGQLAAIYQIGDVAYVGGGFDEGIHNILEPLVYRIPVVFGPKYSKFREAHDLIELDVAGAISNFSDL